MFVPFALLENIAWWALLRVLSAHLVSTVFLAKLRSPVLVHAHQVNMFADRDIVVFDFLTLARKYSSFAAYF